MNYCEAERIFQNIWEQFNRSTSWFASRRHFQCLPDSFLYLTSRKSVICRRVCNHKPEWHPLGYVAQKDMGNAANDDKEKIIIRKHQMALDSRVITILRRTIYIKSCIYGMLFGSNKDNIPPFATHV